MPKKVITKDEREENAKLLSTNFYLRNIMQEADPTSRDWYDKGIKAIHDLSSTANYDKKKMQSYLNTIADFKVEMNEVWDKEVEYFIGVRKSTMNSVNKWLDNLVDYLKQEIDNDCAEEKTTKNDEKRNAALERINEEKREHIARKERLELKEKRLWELYKATKKANKKSYETIKKTLKDNPEYRIPAYQMCLALEGMLPDNMDRVVKVCTESKEIIYDPEVTLKNKEVKLIDYYVEDLEATHKAKNENMQERLDWIKYKRDDEQWVKEVGGIVSKVFKSKRKPESGEKIFPDGDQPYLPKIGDEKIRENMVNRYRILICDDEDKELKELKEIKELKDALNNNEKGEPAQKAVEVKWKSNYIESAYKWAQAIPAMKVYLKKIESNWHNSPEYKHVIECMEEVEKFSKKAAGKKIEDFDMSKFVFLMQRTKNAADLYCELTYSRDVNQERSLIKREATKALAITIDNFFSYVDMVVDEHKKIDMVDDVDNMEIGIMKECLKKMKEEAAKKAEINKPARNSLPAEGNKTEKAKTDNTRMTL